MSGIRFVFGVFVVFVSGVWFFVWLFGCLVRLVSGMCFVFVVFVSGGVWLLYLVVW